MNGWLIDAGSTLFLAVPIGLVLGFLFKRTRPWLGTIFFAWFSLVWLGGLWSSAGDGSIKFLFTAIFILICAASSRQQPREESSGSSCLAIPFMCVWTVLVYGTMGPEWLLRARVHWIGPVEQVVLDNRELPHPGAIGQALARSVSCDHASVPPGQSHRLVVVSQGKRAEYQVALLDNNVVILAPGRNNAVLRSSELGKLIPLR